MCTKIYHSYPDLLWIEVGRVDALLPSRKKIIYKLTAIGASPSRRVVRRVSQG
jgi:hypothetical protein